MSSLGRTLQRKIDVFKRTLDRSDVHAGDKALLVADRVAETLGLRPQVRFTRRFIFELDTPPPQSKGLRDLVVRRGDERDLEALSTIDGTDRDLVKARLQRGDLAYVGQLDDEILCHTWFHRGPSPFEEDRYHCADWAVDGSTFWSYNGAASLEARSSGIFVKMFAVALRDLFEKHGTTRVQGFIFDSNQQSILMHERMGWKRLGVVSTLVLPGVKWIRWEGGGRTRQWVAPRHSDLALAFPPS